MTLRELVENMAPAQKELVLIWNFVNKYGKRYKGSVILGENDTIDEAYTKFTAFKLSDESDHVVAMIFPTRKQATETIDKLFIESDLFG